MRLAACLAVVIALAFLCGCEDDGIDLRITEANFGDTLGAEVGDVIHIALEANATTGYKWICGWDPKRRLNMMDEEYDADNRGTVGAGGVQHFVLEAMRKGRVKITLQYGQPWPGGHRERPRRVTIKIAE